MRAHSRALIVLAVACFPWVTAAQQALPPASEGMRIFLDPVTGQRLAQPPLIPQPQPAPFAELPQPEQSRPELRETKGTSRAGGVLVDLQGQFDQSIEATVGKHGQVDVGCKHSDERQQGGVR